MPVFYVANGTKQNHVFAYRLPGNPKVHQPVIRVGQQLKLPGIENLPAGEQVAAIENIVRHHEKYGMCNADAIDQARGFIPLIYSTDRPIPAAKIERMLRHNVGEKVEEGKEIRKQTAVASAEILENALVEQGRDEKLVEFSSAIIEENHDERDETPAISEGVAVRRDIKAKQMSGRVGNRQGRA